MTLAWLTFMMGTGLILLFISFFIKSILIPMACFCFMIGVVVNTDEIWIQCGAAVLMILCAVKIFIRGTSSGGYD